MPPLGRRWAGAAVSSWSSLEASLAASVTQADEASPEGVAYRAWVVEVLLPLSDRAARLIVERADLLEVSQSCTAPSRCFPIYRHPVTAPPPPLTTALPGRGK